jgi:hypothetical protein
MTTNIFTEHIRAGESVSDTTFGSLRKGDRYINDLGDRCIVAYYHTPRVHRMLGVVLEGEGAGSIKYPPDTQKVWKIIPTEAKLPHEKFTASVPVVNGETGEVVGNAIPATIIAGHMRGNSRPFLVFKGKSVACSFSTKKPNAIRIYPSKQIW